MPVIRLTDITLRRSGFEILRGLSWTIRRGEHWVLLGANGSGKTTLLKVITGYEWPTHGAVEVLGERYGECNLPEVRKHIGWVSSALVHRIPDQDTALSVVLSGLEASMGVYRSFTRKEEERAREALRLLGVKGLEDRTYGILSQGERQRVLIARGLVHQPSLLILDEPCAGLDPMARELFLEDLARLVRGRGAPSLIFVTHHIEEIAPWMNQVYLLHEGRCLAAGKSEDVLTSELLGAAFRTRCVVDRDNGRFSLQVLPDPPGKS